MLHCIAIECDPPGNAPPNKVTQVLENWVGRYDERLPKQRQQATAIEADPARDIPAHINGLWRFANAEDRAAMLDDLEADLDSIGAVEWAVLTPHDCDHGPEDDDFVGCSINESERRVIGTPPEGI